MKKYKVSTLEKKSIQEVETWYKDGQSFTIDQWWRWGHVIISVADDEEFDIEAIKRNEDGFNVDAYDVWDRDLDDGVALAFDTDGDEELEEEVQAMWDDEGYSSFEQAGWNIEDGSTMFYGPLAVELVDD